MNSKYFDESSDCWPIFVQPWWLDTVVGSGNWGECKVEEGGKLVARLPWIKKKKFGITLLTHPPLTQTLGPWFSESSVGRKYSLQLARQKDLTELLIKQLPQHDYFAQNFSPDISNWLPWYWQGYEQTTKYTYRLHDIAEHQRIYEGFQTNIRGDIRKAESKGIVVTTENTLDDFIPLNFAVFARQGIKVPYDEEFLRRLDAVCLDHSARKILIARDASGIPHAGVYLVYNKYCAYNLMIGGNPNLRSSGATSLAMWEAIKFASTVTNTFDFEGSMIESIERFFRGFGATQTAYFRVSAGKSTLGKMMDIGNKCLLSFKGLS